MAEDEQVRARILREPQPRQVLQLTEPECWDLLGSASLGRVVFTMHAMPATRPVNHLVDGKTIIIRSHLGAAIVGHSARDGAVVCYEADQLDPDRHTDWSVAARPGPAESAGRRPGRHSAMAFRIRAKTQPDGGLARVSA